MTNNAELKNKYLVKKVSIMDTMRNMPVGIPILFDAKTCGSYSNAHSAATRLRQRENCDFSVITDDNGTTYTVTRIK